MRNDFQRSLALASTHARRVTLADARALSAPIRQTRHARRRAAQRNLTTTDVEYIVMWGREIRRTGAVFHCLAAKDIPAQHRHLPEIMRLVGAVVLASREEEIITLYRNARALRDIQRKLKYRFTPGRPTIAADVEACEEEEREDDAAPEQNDA